jgi:hypothetical protein
MVAWNRGVLFAALVAGVACWFLPWLRLSRVGGELGRESSHDRYVLRASQSGLELAVGGVSATEQRPEAYPRLLGAPTLPVPAPSIPQIGLAVAFVAAILLALLGGRRAAVFLAPLLWLSLVGTWVLGWVYTDGAVRVMGLPRGVSFANGSGGLPGAFLASQVWLGMGYWLWLGMLTLAAASSLAQLIAQGESGRRLAALAAVVLGGGALIVLAAGLAVWLPEREAARQAAAKEQADREEEQRTTRERDRLREYYEKVKPGMSYEDVCELTLDSRTVLGPCVWSLPDHKSIPPRVPDSQKDVNRLQTAGWGAHVSGEQGVEGTGLAYGLVVTFEGGKVKSKRLVGMK